MDVLRLWLAAALFWGLVSGCAGPLNFSDTLTARTLPAPMTRGAQRVRFAVVGDFGLYGGVTQRHIASRVRALCESDETRCDFLIATGDNLYPDGFDSLNAKSRLREMLDNYGSTPKYLVLGNHDYDPIVHDRETGQAELRFIRETTGLYGGAHFWETTVGPLHLVGIDTDYLVRGAGSDGDPGVSQWLARTLSAETTFRVVVGHHPYLSNGAHGNAGTGFLHSGAEWKRVFEAQIAGSTQLYLSGHDHHLEFYPHSGDAPRAADTALAVVGSSAKCRSQGAARNPEESGISPGMERYGYGFAWVEVTEKRLTVRFYDSNGAKFFEAARGKEEKWSQKGVNTGASDRCDCELKSMEEASVTQCSPSQ